MNELPLELIEFDAARLAQEHPPRLRHPNKQAVFQIACTSGYPVEGIIRYARWNEGTLPPFVTSRSVITARQGFFDYASLQDPNVMEWHVNFADPHLFFGYGSALLAQDELQAAEHPILGSICEALLDMGRQAVTVDANGKPTPVTIRGVQRRVAFDTSPNPAAGHPHGIYGNAFARAPLEQVRSAAHPLHPPTLTNILAMAAPNCGQGEYTRDEIELILLTAFTGFTAARSQSEDGNGSPLQTLVHTGFWGCGAFGGNRRLMTILQILAADLAQVDLVFHAVDRAGVEIVEEARELYARFLNGPRALSAVIESILQQRFRWGISDGN